MQSSVPGSVGQFYSYSLGTGCDVYSSKPFDFDAGFDWRETSTAPAVGFIDPLQGFVRAVYSGSRAGPSPNTWSAALGMDDIGFDAGRTDFDVGYGVVQKRSGETEYELGSYYGNPALLRSGDGGRDNFGAILGLRHSIGRADFGLEWRSGRNRDSYGFVGTRVQFDETLAASVGYAIANDRDYMRDWLLVRLTLQQ